MLLVVLLGGSWQCVAGSRSNPWPSALSTSSSLYPPNWSQLSPDCQRGVNETIDGVFRFDTDYLKRKAC